jgi:hypothetical protein
VKRILFFENQQRSFVADALMRTMTVILHLPQPVLISSFFATGKTHLRKTFFIIRPVAALNNAVSPGTCPLNQRVDSAGCFNRFGKTGFPFRMGGVFHRKIHRIIGESYEKGGSESKARW